MAFHGSVRLKSYRSLGMNFPPPIDEAAYGLCCSTCGKDFTAGNNDEAVEEYGVERNCKECGPLPIIDKPKTQSLWDDFKNLFL